ncbi:hypothetical protein J6590_025702 [Homalodisca vitripennis]|nr:hypothetical protein J6590_025702 [Homalodisca vitripennis]
MMGPFFLPKACGSSGQLPVFVPACIRSLSGRDWFTSDNRYPLARVRCFVPRTENEHPRSHCLLSYRGIHALRSSALDPRLSPMKSRLPFLPREGRKTFVSSWDGNVAHVLHSLFTPLPPTTLLQRRERETNQGVRSRSETRPPWSVARLRYSGALVFQPSTVRRSPLHSFSLPISVPGSVSNLSVSTHVP